MIGRPPPATWEAVEEAVANGVREVGLARLVPRPDGSPGYIGIGTGPDDDIAHAHHRASELVWSLHGLDYPGWDEWSAFQEIPLDERLRSPQWWHDQMDAALGVDRVSGGR